MATTQSDLNTNSNAPVANTDEEFMLGFQRVEAAVRAVPENNLLPLNLDVPSTVTTVLGAWPEIRAFRDTVSALPGANMTAFDNLRDYALALAHTHGLFRGLSGPPDGLTKMAEELSNIRDMLFADAMALAKRGVFDETRITKLRSGLGYKSLAFDVVGLVQILRERWADISNRTGVQQAELDHAAQLAQRLVTAVGLKEQQPVATNGVTLLRQQAFTLLVNAYDEVRRAISFLRWHEQDVESIAPSLWSGRGSRVTPDAPPVPPPAPIEPAPAATANPAAPITAGASPVPVGLPGAPAFSRT